MKLGLEIPDNSELLVRDRRGRDLRQAPGVTHRPVYGCSSRAVYASSLGAMPTMAILTAVLSAVSVHKDLMTHVGKRRSESPESPEILTFGSTSLSLI